MRAIIAEKKGMTHIFDEAGNQVPVTVLLATSNKVTQIKSQENDGYVAMQVGFGEKKNHKKPQEGHLAKAGSRAKKIKELPLVEGLVQNIGDEIKADIFTEGEKVSVKAISKGKGFAGTIKRHNFHCGPMTHGSRNHRAPGSIGAGYPQHVFKGQKLPGRMGADQVTVKNLKIAKIILEENIILIKGAIPGPKKGIVIITANNIKTESKDA